MAIDSTHPAYDASIEDWQLMRDSNAGERTVKARGVKYLPATPGQILDGQGKPTSTKDNIGEQAYAGYKGRAVFPEYVTDAIEFYIGLLFQKPPSFELPAAMEALLEKASSDGESLHALLRRINVEQLTSGRVGLMLDMPINPDPANPLPYVAVYVAETVINWDDSSDHSGINDLGLVVLNETGPVRRSDLTWETKERFRILMKGEMPAVEGVNGEPGTPGFPPGTYIQGVFDKNDGADFGNTSVMRAPMLRGKTLEQIPFVFVNTKDIVSTPDKPPLLGLARLCMTIYRGEADYRQTLFMQGQDTLVTIGTIMDPDGASTSVSGPNDGLRVGAGSRISMDIGSDAKYIGVGSEGLTEQREALAADRLQAETRAGQMISPAAGKQESGDALTTRLGAQTATLKQIAETGAFALQNVLRIAAEWMGQDPEKVVVTPNLEFVDQKLDPADLVALMSARTMGAPLSLESIHEILVARGLTSKTLEEELDLIAEEDLQSTKLAAKLAAMLPAPTPGSRPSGAPSPAPGGAA